MAPKWRTISPLTDLRKLLFNGKKEQVLPERYFPCIEWQCENYFSFNKQETINKMVTALCILEKMLEIQFWTDLSCFIFDENEMLISYHLLTVHWLITSICLNCSCRSTITSPKLFFVQNYTKKLRCKILFLITLLWNDLHNNRCLHCYGNKTQ